MDISKIDSNLASLGIEGQEIEWFSSLDDRFSLYGIYYDKEENIFRRVPDELSKKTKNPGLPTL